MKTWKIVCVKCLLLLSELLAGFLTVDILWQLLDGRPLFSFPLYLFSGVLVTAANSLFLQKKRRLWTILVLNAALCALWAPLLGRTLDLTFPPLLVLQLPLFLIPLCRGYRQAVTPVTVRRVQSCGELTGMYSLFYLIVVSFVPQLLPRAPVLLAVLVLELLAAVLLRTAGRNTIRAGSPLSRVPALLAPLLLAGAAVGVCVLLAFYHEELLPFFLAAGSLLEQGAAAAVLFLAALFRGRSANIGEAAAPSGGRYAQDFFQEDTGGGASLDPRVLTGLLALLFAVAALTLLAALLRWFWKNRNRVRGPDENGEDDMTRTRLKRRGLWDRFREGLQIRAFLLRHRGTSRAALLQLERWGAQHRCRRCAQETPREFLERLGAERLHESLTEAQQACYVLLTEDVERSLYGALPPQLSRKQVRELITAVQSSAG